MVSLPKGILIRKYFCTTCQKEFAVESLDYGINTNTLKTPIWFDEDCGHWDHQQYKGFVYIIA